MNKFATKKDRNYTLFGTLPFQIEKINLHYSRHHNIHNFPMNIIAVLEAYCFFDKKSRNTMK